MKVLVIQSCLTLCNPWTVARQAPLPMEFSRQEYWSGLPFPSPGDLSNSGIEPGSPALQANSYHLSHIFKNIHIFKEDTFGRQCWENSGGLRS